MLASRHSARYRWYLQSSAWQAKRQAVLTRAGGRCERCQAAEARYVHHLTYVHLCDEPLEDLIALCGACHEAADRQRQADGKLRRYRAQVEGWARKVYGAAWAETRPWTEVANEFDAWLRRKRRRSSP